MSTQPDGSNRLHPNDQHHHTQTPTPGVKVLTEVLPVSVEKQGDDGRLLVKFSTGEEDTFDTVLSARGRYPDLGALNAAGIGLAMDSSTGKLLCRGEQTSVPHVYAVGDVVQGTPELTPVAIQAGTLLARRCVASLCVSRMWGVCVCVCAAGIGAHACLLACLAGWLAGGSILPHHQSHNPPTQHQPSLFGGATEQMDYRSVATTVFTPLEYGCVGLSEEQATEDLGADGFQVRACLWLRPFSPPSHHLLKPTPFNPRHLPPICRSTTQSSSRWSGPLCTSAGLAAPSPRCW